MGKLLNDMHYSEELEYNSWNERNVFYKVDRVYPEHIKPDIDSFYYEGNVVPESAARTDFVPERGAENSAPLPPTVTRDKLGRFVLKYTPAVGSTDAQRAVNIMFADFTGIPDSLKFAEPGKLYITATSTENPLQNPVEYLLNEHYTEIYNEDAYDPATGLYKPRKLVIGVAPLLKGTTGLSRWPAKTSIHIAFYALRRVA